MSEDTLANRPGSGRLDGRVAIVVGAGQSPVGEQPGRHHDRQRTGDLTALRP
ncbi:MAG: hypothetical protein R2710_15200 [Acidimicrobiales bacterium]